MTEEKHKRCFKCGETKPLSDFYKHPRMADGHVNKCKECNKKDVRENRVDKIDYYTEYDKERNKQRGTVRHLSKIKYGRRKDVQERNRKHPITESTKRARVLSESRRKQIYPERFKANSAVSNAIRDNRLIRPSCCQHCGKECKPQAHHSSYSEDMWLMVTWLCTSCHGEVHRLYD